MKIEVIFEPASKPKIFRRVRDVYTKGRLIVIAFKRKRNKHGKKKRKRMLGKYPEGRIHSIYHVHKSHKGSKH